MSNLRFFVTLFITVVLAASSCAATEEKSRKQTVQFYELKKGDISVIFTNLGARVVSINVPDRNGELANVIVGDDTIKSYQAHNSYFDGNIGTAYNPEADAGENTFAGRRKGFDEFVWKVKKHKKSGEKPQITFRNYDFDGEQGSADNLLVTVTYSLLKNNKLKVEIQAKTKDESTPAVNFAQHLAWNLAGHGNILSHQLQIFASNITKLVTKNLIETSKVVPVEHTPYDFLQPHAIRKLISYKLIKHGYGVDYIVDNVKKQQSHKLAAILQDASSGRVLKLWTTQPLLRVETANKYTSVEGEDGALYERYAGVILDPQAYPYSLELNDGQFSSQFITRGEPYEESTIFEFTTYT